MTAPDLKTAINRLRSINRPGGGTALQPAGSNQAGSITSQYEAADQEWQASFELMVEGIIDSAVTEARRDFARDLEGLHIRQLEELPRTVRAQIAPLIDGRASRDDIARLIADLDARFDELPGAMTVLGGSRRSRRTWLIWGMIALLVLLAFAGGVVLSEPVREWLAVGGFDLNSLLSPAQ